MNKSKYSKYNEEWVRLYLVEMWRMNRIAKLYGCDPAVVNYQLKKMKVQIRSKSEALKGRKHSDETRRKLSEALKGRFTGSLRTNFKGDPDNQGYNYKFRSNSGSGKAFQKLILERDNYTCQDCGRSCKGLKMMFQRHHINFDKLDNRPENLVLLCHSCHNKRHKRESVIV